MNIQIIVGSVTGNADELADKVRILLQDYGHDIRINRTFTPTDLAGDDFLILCHSNTGAGDLPDNILPLYLHLTRDYPRIAGRRYAVINLGDSSYATFNEAGRMLDAAFEDLGAVKCGESLVFDASEDEKITQRLTDWITALNPLLS